MKKLIVKAKHFNGRTFTDTTNCPVATAAKEQFKTDRVKEVVSYIIIDGTHYGHDDYDYEKYLEDLEKVGRKNDPEAIIRTIKLEKA